MDGATFHDHDETGRIGTIVLFSQAHGEREIELLQILINPKSRGGAVTLVRSL